MSLSQIELVWVRDRLEGRVYLSESEKRKQCVWIPQMSEVWIQDGTIQDAKIQDGHHH